MTRIHVSMLFKGRKGKADLTFLKDLHLPNPDALEIETAILSIPFINAAEARGLTLACYDWHIAAEEQDAPTAN